MVLLLFTRVKVVSFDRIKEDQFPLKWSLFLIDSFWKGSFGERSKTSSTQQISMPHLWQIKDRDGHRVKEGVDQYDTQTIVVSWAEFMTTEDSLGGSLHSFLDGFCDSTRD